jgi:voltage-gated potassium channel
MQMIGRVGKTARTAAEIDAQLRIPMTVAALLVIPDLILEEQPLRHSWHEVAVIGDWLIWLVFLAELLAIGLLAEDRASWLRQYPLAPALLVLTPPFAPAAVQGLRAFRLLRLLRVARGFQLLSRALTLEGVKYAAAFSVVLVIGGGLAFSEVESHAGEHISSWTGIWWAIGVVTTTGSKIEVTTDAGKAISIVLMLTGICVFSLVTAAVAQRFVASKAESRVAKLSAAEQAILDRLDQLSDRVEAIEQKVTR